MIKKIKDINFTNSFLNKRENVLIGFNEKERLLIKIEIKKAKGKINDIKKEYEIINFLNDKNCETCPKVYELGRVKKQFIVEKIFKDFKSEKEEFDYILMEYIPHSEEYSLSDLMLAIVEQKVLGVYQGDIKPDNIRFNPENKVCYLIDYDQAIVLSDSEKSKNNDDFLTFMNDYDKKRYNIGDWTRHFKSKYTKSQIDNLFVNGSLNIVDTTLIKTQNTTNTEDGLYHSIDDKNIFLVGRRSLESRGKLLDSVEFFKGEKVLDVGCNQGLLSFYLSDRGCDVRGIDIDPYIITAAKITNNIMEKNVIFDHENIDNVQELDKYDTIMLFSVLHHTINQRENFAKINKSCNRIILETRLVENGSQPLGENGSWVPVARWNFSSTDHLTSTFEKDVFPDFRFNRKIGDCDKGRMILEFVRK